MYDHDKYTNMGNSRKYRLEIMTMISGYTLSLYANSFNLSACRWAVSTWSVLQRQSFTG